MGNIDAFLVKVLPDPRLEKMDEGKVEHHLWTHNQLTTHRKQVWVEAERK